VLSSSGDIFAAAAKKYGIDPALLAAIAIHETGNGTSNAAKSKNNVGGMMRSKGGLMEFSSLEEGIDKMASNLKRNYIDKGLTTIPQIQKKYAPIGATNDPTSLNKHWVDGVTKFYKSLSS
jgi:beta-N-acetylglucosaminidase